MSVSIALDLRHLLVVLALALGLLTASAAIAIPALAGPGPIGTAGRCETSGPGPSIYEAAGGACVVFLREGDRYTLSTEPGEHGYVGSAPVVIRPGEVLTIVTET